MQIDLSQADLVIQITQHIITKAGLDTLPKALIDEYQERLAVEIQRRIGLLSLGMLDEAGRKQMEEWSKIASPTPQAFVAFFQKNVPNYETRLAELIEQLAQEIVEKLKLKA